MRISDWSSDVCSSDLFEMRSAPVVGGVNVQKGNGEIIRMRRGASISDFADKIESLTGYTVQTGTLVTILLNLGELETAERKSVVKGQSEQVRVDIGVSRLIKKKTTKK